MLQTLYYSRFVLRLSVNLVLALVLSLPSVSSAQQVSVPATFHKQEHSLSCEIATLKMALGVHGIDIPESELVSKLAFDPTPKSNGVWGDPHKGFVGKIDGLMLVSGYGVYWGPIAAVGDKYARTQVMRNGSASRLARAITEGNSVIIWGYYGAREVYSWKTPAGKSIHTVGGEHTRLVYGFDGPVTAPTRFYIIDPFSGPSSWSTAELMHNWSSLNHMGVIVSKDSKWVRAPGDTDIWEVDTKKNTRRLIATWEKFIGRGGSSASVVDIARGALLKYKSSTPIN